MIACARIRFDGNAERRWSVARFLNVYVVAYCTYRRRSTATYLSSAIIFNEPSGRTHSYGSLVTFSVCRQWPLKIRKIEKRTTDNINSVGLCKCVCVCECGTFQKDGSRLWEAHLILVNLIILLPTRPKWAKTERERERCGQLVALKRSFPHTYATTKALYVCYNHETLSTKISYKSRNESNRNGEAKRPLLTPPPQLFYVYLSAFSNSIDE